MSVLHILVAAVASATVAIAAVLSARAYDHRDEHYAKDQPSPGSIRHFRFVYRYLQVSSIAIALISFWASPRWLLELHDSMGLILLGTFGICLSTWAFLSAKRALGNQYSPCFDAYLPQRIVEEGPYAQVRHPIYTANVALLASLALASGSVWLVLNTFVLAAYYGLSAKAEEGELLRAHPDYAAYVARTGRVLPSIKG